MIFEFILDLIAHMGELIFKIIFYLIWDGLNRNVYISVFLNLALLGFLLYLMYQAIT